MAARIVRAARREGTSRFQFVQRIPTDLRDRAGGKSVVVPLGAETVFVRIKPDQAALRFSLRTSDPSEAKRRQGTAAVAVEAFWSALRSSRPTTLSNRQVVALAGDLYRAWAASEGRERVTAVQLTETGRWARSSETAAEEAAGFRSALRRLIEQTDAEGLEPTLGPLVSRMLLTRGIAQVDPDTWAALLEAFGLALQDAFSARQRNAEGDFRPDLQAERFPSWDADALTPEPLPFASLVAAWWADREPAGIKPGTHESLRGVVGQLSAFLGHDDAKRVEEEDVARFRNHRLKTVTAQTIKNKDLPALRSLFGWAVENKRLTANPAKGVTLKAGKAVRLRSKWFTDEEAEAILTNARATKRKGRASIRLTSARRWVPWVLAYTGARVGEIAQLRRQDVREGKHGWYLAVTPEAGTVKTNEAREVPLHPHLVEEGFLEFVQKARPGHLFVEPSEAGDVRVPVLVLTSQIAKAVREVVKDPNVAPNHGWRHRFKTVGHESGIHPRVLDVIQGHVPRTEGESYGEVSLRVMAEAVAKMPRQV